MEEILNEPGMVCIGEPNLARMVRDAQEILKLTNKDIIGIYQRMEKQVDSLMQGRYRFTDAPEK